MDPLSSLAPTIVAVGVLGYVVYWAAHKGTTDALKKHGGLGRSRDADSTDANPNADSR